jgi:pyruvate/2-oxoglutarate dehydrogenase complex dihydrolipoamide acyltransferase (E2) component
MWRLAARSRTGQIVGQVETDKAVLDVTAAAAGFVLGFVANPDEVVKVGSVMLWLGENVDEGIPEPQETSFAAVNR